MCLVTQLINGKAGMRIPTFNHYALHKCSERKNTRQLLFYSKDRNRNRTIGPFNFLILFIVFGGDM